MVGLWRAAAACALCADSCKCFIKVMNCSAWTNLRRTLQQPCHNPPWQRAVTRRQHDPSAPPTAATQRRADSEIHKKSVAILGLSCHPYAGAMLIFSVCFQFFQMPRLTLGDCAENGEKHKYAGDAAGRVGCGLWKTVAACVVYGTQWCDECG